MEVFLKYGVLFSVFISLISLVYLVYKTFSFSNKPLYAASQGKSIKGIVYALGEGMMPWEKDSAKKHLVTYVAGVFYHIGIFASFLYLFSVIFGANLPFVLTRVFQAVVIISLVCGIGLLIKRMTRSYMMKISCPDDFFSNIIVDVFLIWGLIDTFTVSFRHVFYIISIIMIFYMPLGKIRHCFFFFYSRILFGSFYGRRGVFPENQRRLKRFEG